MFYAYTRPRYQVSVYRTIGHLVHYFTLKKSELFVSSLFLYMHSAHGQTLFIPYQSFVLFSFFSIV